MRGIVKFLEDVDEYKPTVPEAIVQHYLQLGGAATDDPRILKLVALATDHFLANIVKDAKSTGELRVGEKRPATGDEQEYTLTMEDVAEALRGRGVKISKCASYSVDEN